MQVKGFECATFDAYQLSMTILVLILMTLLKS
jgi:hypothetical protein